MIYTIDEIKEKIKPIAKKYNIEIVYLFGSYARGDATEESDVDLLVNADNVPGLKFSGLYTDLEEALEKEADLITERQLSQTGRAYCGHFNVMNNGTIINLPDECIV